MVFSSFFFFGWFGFVGSSVSPLKYAFIQRVIFRWGLQRIFTRLLLLEAICLQRTYQFWALCRDDFWVKRNFPS